MLKKLIKTRESSDWLNPMLVKELRQSVRSKQFVGVFVIVQIVMILFVTFGLATTTSASDMQELSHVFWTIIVIYLIGILPMSGLNALSREFDDARLDLLQLSSMRSRGIVIGKWLSLNLQGWLVVLSLLPYIVLRYFVGSVNPLHDLMTLAGILYFSMICSAAAITVSVVHNKIARVFILIAAVIGFFMLLGFGSSFLFMYGSMSGTMGLTSSNPWLTILFVLAVSIPVGGLFLEFASSRISPDAENHETPKRLYMLVILAVWGIAYLTDAEHELFLFPVFLGALVVGVGSMCGEPLGLATIYLPFMRLGAAGRFLGRMLFYPGWPSGANFCLLLYFCVGGICFIIDPSEFSLVLLFLTCCLSSLLLPRAISIVAKFHSSGVRMFMLIQLVGVCLAILALLIEETRDLEVTTGLFLVPQAGVIYSMDHIQEHSGQYILFLLGNFAVAGISYLVIVLGSWRLRSAFAKFEGEAVELIQKKRLAKAEQIPAQTAAAEA